MKNQNWKKFSKLTEKCYLNMIGAEKNGSCWQQAFELLKEIVLEERKEHPNYASQLETLDDATDYDYDIQGWLEDCLDEIDMKGEYETLLSMCEDLLNLFEWPEYTGSDIRFQKASALGALDRCEEAADYCREWIEKEPENIVAATAGVYAFIEMNQFEEAEELIDRFISDKSVCSDENDIMFIAAAKLYEAAGKRAEKRRIDKAMKEYEKYLKEYYESFGVDEEGDELSDWDFPF